MSDRWREWNLARIQPVDGLRKASGDAAFAAIVAAQKILDRWARTLDDPNKHQPTMRCGYGGAFSCLEAARDAALRADRWRFLAMFPHSALYYAPLLPPRFVAAFRRCKTDAAVLALIEKARRGTFD